MFCGSLAALPWPTHDTARSGISEGVPWGATIAAAVAGLLHIGHHRGVVSEDGWWAQGIDVYSNILYVKEGQAQLSHLAHRMLAAHKFRPETCCIVGNYFSLKGDHEQASPARTACITLLAA